jgi:hypothetical protein
MRSSRRESHVPAFEMIYAKTSLTKIWGGSSDTWDRFKALRA